MSGLLGLALLDIAAYFEPMSSPLKLNFDPNPASFASNPA